MSGYACATCADVGPLFAGNAGIALATELDIPLIGRVPFHPSGAPEEMFDNIAARLEELLP